MTAVAGDNVEAIRQMWEAYGRRDLDGVLACIHPDVEWREAVHLFDRGVYRGHDGIRQLWQENDEVFPALQIDVDDAFDAGDGTVVVIGRFHDSVRGVETTIRFVHICKLRDGLLAELTEYEDAEQVSALLNARSGS